MQGFAPDLIVLSHVFSLEKLETSFQDFFRGGTAIVLPSVLYYTHMKLRLTRNEKEMIELVLIFVAAVMVTPVAIFLLAILLAL